MKNKKIQYGVLVAGMAAGILLAACSRSSAVSGAYPNTVIGANQLLLPDGQGKPCQTGVGRTYDVNIPSPLGNGEMIGATVFEPALIDCNQKYPLLLWHNGFATARPQTLVPLDPVTDVYTVLAPFTALIAAGYGVITFDPRGTGTSGGKIRVMDPDYEGANAVRVVDWAEANLDWLAYGASVDGSDPHNLMLGSIGPSYGGGFQNMLLAIDPKHRLDAIVPIITWNDLKYTFNSNDVVHSGFLSYLHGLAPAEKFDPFVNQQLDQAITDGRASSELLDFLGYHGLNYFCDGQDVASNGGLGTAPRLAPRLPPKVNALFIQSSRDTLFNLNQAVANYECLKPNGADVRLWTIQAGHNTIGLLGTLGVSPIPADPGVIYQPDPTSLGVTCGGTINVAAILAFFNEHLKGMTGQVDQALGSEPICLSLTALDSIKVDAIQRGGAKFDIAADAAGNTVTVGQDDSQNTTVPLLTVSGVSKVLAGIPTMDITLTDPDHPSATGGDTVIFVGIGQKHLIGVTPWDLVDNQLTPLRGLGHHKIEMSGVLERALVGDQLGLMIFGANANQFPTTGLTAHPKQAKTVQVKGTVQLPFLGNAD